jgi:hypothetical protein
MSIEIGPFKTNEIPAPLLFTFQASDGTPLDLTGYTAKFVYEAGNTTEVVRDADITDEENGQVTYTWVASDMAAAAVYRAEFVVGNGSNRHASPDIKYRVSQAVWDTPTV